MYSPETASKLALFRQKVADNTISDEELQESVALLREGRRTATENAVKRRVSAKKSVKSVEDLLSELENLG